MRNSLNCLTEKLIKIGLKRIRTCPQDSDACALSIAPVSRYNKDALFYVDMQKGLSTPEWLKSWHVAAIIIENKSVGLKIELSSLFFLLFSV